jgi:predicted phage terminase large subunit-like protein
MSRSRVTNDCEIPDLICRLDFVSFVRRCFRTLSPNSEFLPNWHIYALCYELEQVYRGNVTRLNVNFPRRMLKSNICSVAFPAFVLGHDPTKRIIVISYGTDLATKLANDFRIIINSSWYRRIFPATRISRNKNSEFEVVTTQNGCRLAVSIDGPLTGRGGDIIILDDPLKAMDARSDSKREHVNESFTNTILGGLDNKQTGVIILVMQRLHPDDLSGRVQRLSDEWETLSFPAIAEREERIQIGPHQFHERHVGDVLHPERAPLERLEEIRSQMSAEDFAAQYQQNPIPPGGVMIQRRWLRYYDQLPDRTGSFCVIQSWDTASKDGSLNDWSVCTTWLLHEGKYYLMDVLRERLDYPSLKARAIMHARAYNPSKVLIEDTGVGTALVAELKRAGLIAIAVKPERNKKTRMSIQSAKFESGLVFFPKQAPWLAAYEGEIFAFPNVQYDDQVDSTAQALASDHSTYDLNADGMENLISALVFRKMFGG